MTISRLSKLSAMALAAMLAAPALARAEGAQGGDNAACLSCHGTPGFSLKESDGRTRSLFVPAEGFAHSAHGALPCLACHAGMAEVPHKAVTASPLELRRHIPELCGSCHAKALADYRNSVHGKALAAGAGSAAVCTDCHGAHGVMNPQLPATRLAITKDCATCHAGAAASYRETYHGQILALGYAKTATCADCHRGHAILPASESGSSVSRANLLRTCRNCHSNATAGFGTFEAHATTDDFARYPYSWLASKLLIALMVSVFGLLWPHSALWFYRELRDRQARKARPHVRAEALPPGGARQYRRWSAAWRLAHLVFVLSVMTLIVTGLPLLYPTAPWAKLLEAASGGPGVAGLAHRIAAVIMTAIFLGHLVYAALHLGRIWKSFKWFGPYSLLPNWQDAKDFLAMNKWFFGLAPRPRFDHWNYLQKIDYWGPFWGIAILAGTGLMLWFAPLTAAYLPGWAINAATVAHGEDALFATLYLFTIHYFVNHWRPDKFPLDIVIFTGSMPLEEFKREYALEYERLEARGELERYLVEVPSRPMTLGSQILGFALVAVGVLVLAMIVTGASGMFAGG